jgi:NO-binding membrane sensor protein with MHYT domain
MYVASYNSSLVLCSLFVAILASYTALNVSARVATAQKRVTRLWLVGGALALGVGTWSMHFIGMLAFHLPIVLSPSSPWGFPLPPRPLLFGW